MDIKKIFSYIFILIAFYIISIVLENGLIEGMYVKMNGTINNKTYVKGIFTEIGIDVKESRATNVNGYMDLTIKNNMNSNLEKAYLQVDLYNERDLLAETEYIEINNLESGKGRNYNIKFKANNIEGYKVSLIEQAPDESHIIRILGWEIDYKKLGIDPTNVFGLGIDLTNLFGTGIDLTKIFNWEKIKQGGISAWNFAVDFATSIPVWAYVIASGIVLWNLPSGYLFFL